MKTQSQLCAHQRRIECERNVTVEIVAAVASHRTMLALASILSLEAVH